MALPVPILHKRNFKPLFVTAVTGWYPWMFAYTYETVGHATIERGARWGPFQTSKAGGTSSMPCNFSRTADIYPRGRVTMPLNIMCMVQELTKSAGTNHAYTSKASGHGL
jgi:hypothetical protein